MMKEYKKNPNGGCVILTILPLFITAIPAVIVAVTSISPGDAAAIVAVELVARASLRAIFFVAFVPTVVVTIASIVEPELSKVNFHQGIGVI